MYPSSTYAVVYKGKDPNSYYDSIFSNQQTMAVINKYWNKFADEIREGRGEFDPEKLAQVTLDDADIPTLKPLITFSDFYTKSQVAKYNAVRAKLSIPTLTDLSTVLTEREKAQLMLQAILAVVKGHFIRQRITINGHGLSGHSYNIETRKFAQSRGWFYTENYYGLYNAPVEAPKTLGFPADFASSIFFKAIMGERRGFEKYRDSSDFTSSQNEWGHLLVSVDASQSKFYGGVVVVKQQPKDGDQDSPFNSYRFNSIDMMFKVGNNNKS
ncbi:hypothetical protein [[Mycoplasma] imitans]|uniref:hypothetical protein n=1 Tax=[Mycoplasma] imitans TaxID=29560 RepID=UPI000482825E|nr:hypothetical protein [[Mycoplasma] imitans]